VYKPFSRPLFRPLLGAPFALSPDPAPFGAPAPAAPFEADDEDDDVETAATGDAAAETVFDVA